MDHTTKTMSGTNETISKKRLYLGGVIFFVGLLCPLLVPLVTYTGLSAAWKATLSGLLLLGIPEIFMLITAAVMGKDGFAYLKGLLFGFLKRHVVPKTVSPGRYRIGLVVFFLPILWGWLAPYLSQFVSIQEQNLTFAVAGDLLLLTGLLLLGGEFWEKLKSLFLYRTEVIIREDHR